MSLIEAIALVLIIEGLAPLLIPKAWKKMLLSLTNVPIESLRIFGGILIGIGILILNVI